MMSRVKNRGRTPANQLDGKGTATLALPETDRVDIPLQQSNEDRMKELEVLYYYSDSSNDY